jgi:hypothetical protein
MLIKMNLTIILIIKHCTFTCAHSDLVWNRIIECCLFTYALDAIERTHGSHLV